MIGQESTTLTPLTLEKQKAPGESSKYRIGFNLKSIVKNSAANDNLKLTPAQEKENAKKKKAEAA